ncbi:MAG: hypothetical protein IJD26_09065, partial [Lachnospiraceae bacterium]|nr:hypothetical protein [Lachnospiraceae bacterium]
SKNPYHGYYKRNENDGTVVKSNYVANFIILTKIANVYGAVDDFDSVSNRTCVRMLIQKLFQEDSSYMYEADLEAIKEDFAYPDERFGGWSWNDIFESMTEEDKEKNKSNIVLETAPEVTPENIRYFICGVALHTLTDVYAHSTFTYQGGEWKRLTHNNNDFSKSCDNPNLIPKRWAAAQNAAYSYMVKMEIGEDGENLLDFTFFSNAPFGTFYLANLSEYAQDASPKHYEWVKSYLNKGDLWTCVERTKIDENEVDILTPMN